MIVVVLLREEKAFSEEKNCAALKSLFLWIDLGGGHLYSRCYRAKLLEQC